VRYETAADFVREYAENLSRGGLFVRGAAGLNVDRDVMVEIDLPGYGAYQVRAEVMHVISGEMADKHGRAPGAGLAIREAPAGFEEALSGYLVRLGRRADALVYAVGDEAVRLLVAAGYQVQPVDSPDALAEVLDRKAAPVTGVVVPEPELESYRRTARDTASKELLVGMHGPEELDEILVRLDRRL
jgi:hypothetical protein